MFDSTRFSSVNLVYIVDKYIGLLSFDDFMACMKPESYELSKAKRMKKEIKLKQMLQKTKFTQGKLTL